MQILFTSNSKYILRLIVFFSILGIIIIGAIFIADKLDDDVNDIKSLWLDIYAAEPDSVDIVFLGSSHANSTFAPKVFDSITGKSSFNLGSSNQTPETGYYIFKEFLKEQHPQILVQEVYWVLMGDKVEVTAVNTQQLLYMRPGVNWAGIFINTFSSEEKGTFLIKGINPFYRLKGIGIRYFSAKSVDARNVKSVQYQGRGYRPYLITANGGKKDEVIEKLSGFNGYSPKQIAYLQRTIDLAKSNDMDVILVMAPIMPEVFDALTFYDEVEQVTTEIAQNNGVEYIDFNRLLDNKEVVLPIDYFGDEHHVNDKGAEIVSTYLAEYMNSNGICRYL